MSFLVRQFLEGTVPSRSRGPRRVVPAADQDALFGMLGRMDQELRARHPDLFVQVDLIRSGRRWVSDGEIDLWADVWSLW